jgi:hypothetical protein
LKETVEYPVSFRSIFFGTKEQKKLDQLTDSQVTLHDEVDREKPVSLRSLLTFQVIIAAANYAFLSLVDIAFRAIQPLFFSTPIELGGLGLPPSTIGNILSTFGVLNGCFQIFFFARIHDYWGSKKVFMAGIASSIGLFLSFPVINLIARSEGYTLRLWIVVGMQIVLSILPSLSYGACFTPGIACDISLTHLSRRYFHIYPSCIP